LRESDRIKEGKSLNLGCLVYFSGRVMENTREDTAVRVEVSVLLV
jgi:hypothetical protein